jgi:hypothetical protein
MDADFHGSFYAEEIREWREWALAFMAHFTQRNNEPSFPFLFAFIRG